MIPFLAEELQKRENKEIQEKKMFLVCRDTSLSCQKKIDQIRKK